MVEEVKETSSGAPSNEVGSMKTGDYMIHVYVIQGKTFLLDGADTVSPIITVSTCGFTKYTAAKEDVACKSQAPNSWREHLFFEPRQMHSSVIEGETISIQVKNKSMFRDEMIGTYDFDITSVYFKDKHAIQHQWVALFNPEGEDFSQVTGYLQLSIAVQGPGDEQVQLDDCTGPEAADQAVMMPAQIKKEFKQLKLRFIQAEKLPKMDTWGTIDAYIMTKFMGKKLKTKAVTAKNDIAPIEQEYWLPIQWPLASDRLLLQILDEDTVNDEIVGSLFFSLKKLVKDGEKIGGKFFWHNLYGSPVDYSGSVCTAMDENPEMGSSWKGRILMHVECKNADHPERRIQALEEQVKQDAINLGFFNDKEFEIIAEVGMGICLPANSSKYKVKIKINDFEMTTSDPKESKNGYNRWSERFVKQTIKTKYSSIAEMDNIFVYLMDGKHPICYWKGKVSEFLDPNPKQRWLILKVDKAVGKVDNDYESGMIQIKMSIADKAKNGGQSFNFDQQPSWKAKPPRRLGSKKIRCFIFQCRNIPSADSDGSSDSYISVWNPEGDQYRTAIIEDSLNPIYLETIEMLYDMADLDTAPPVVFNIWDRDDEILDSTDDFLGRAVIYLHEASSNLQDQGNGDEDAYCNTMPKPKWHDIRVGFDETQPACGQVLCSFIIARDDFDFQTPAKYMDLDALIPKKDYQLDINVLGLRNLESFGLMPIKKPYVKFRVKSLLPPAKAQAVTNVQTDPNANGPNPNINTQLTFNVNLPTETLYCPALECDAYDFVFRGFSQPLIGTFSIPIGEIKKAREEQWQSDLDLQDSIIEMLKKHSNKTGDQIKEEAKHNQEQAIAITMNKRIGAKMQQRAIANLVNNPDLKQEESKGEERLIATDRQDGYGQLVDGSDGEEFGDLEKGGRRLDSEPAPADLEATKLLEQSDVLEDSIFKDLDPSDPLIVRKKEVDKIKKMLAMELVKRADKHKEKTSESDKIKANLQRQLLNSQVKFKEEQKKAIKVKRELEKQQMKDAGGESHQNIILPKYEYNEKLAVYNEVNPPPRSLYKAVGFNDLDRISTMMEGNDSEKRSADWQAMRKDFSSSIRRKDTKMDRKAKLQEELLLQKEQSRLEKITNLHYRKFYEDELENDTSIFSEANKPFVNIDIKRGQSRGLKKSWFSFFSADKVDESGEVTDLKVVGQFKGRVQIYNREELAQYKAQKKERMQEIIQHLNTIHIKVFGEPMDTKPSQINTQEAIEKFKIKLEQMNVANPQLCEFIKDASYDEIIAKQLLQQTNCKIQLYMLEGFDFASRDIGSFSDPYLIVSCGDRSFSERDNYQLDEANPKFYKLYEFTGIFPGAPQIIIDAYDYDDLFGDDLIGRTIIDLDDRFFNGDWQSIEEKPIEYRQIYHESTSLSQGVVTCWLEIEPSTKSDKEQKIWDIQPEPVKDYEIRLSVMETENVPCEDVEGVSDVFMRCYFDDDDKKDTDTHFRCSNGAASFNYRLKFNVQGPRKEPLMLVMQAWDFDLFSPNDYICEWTLDLEELFKNVRVTQKQAIFNKDYYNAFIKPNLPPSKREDIQFKDDDSFILTTRDKEGKPVKVRIDLRIVPVTIASKMPVGEARQEPNNSPHLPPPVGRIQFSLNPFKMLAQLVGPEFLAKIYGIACVLICCVLCIMMLPMLFSNFTSAIVLKILGVSN